VKAYRGRGYRVVATSRSVKPTNDKDVVAVAGDIADPKTAEAENWGWGGLPVPEFRKQRKAK